MSEKPKIKEIDLPHYTRTFDRYNGPCSGEIHMLWDEYRDLRKKYDRLYAAGLKLCDSEGDLKAVHIEHGIFREFREAMDDG